MGDGKLVLGDYFLGFTTREVSGSNRPWRLYYGSEEEAGIKEPRCGTAFSGDLYVGGEIKDIASTYYPAIGPYDTTDPDVAEFHVLLAKAVGIDGFMAEFTIGQEANLLNLVAAARKYDFRVGVNWISQSHLGENVWADRGAAIAKAHEVVRWLAENVYKPCGVRGTDGKYLMLIFLAHPRRPGKEFDPWFSPEEVDALKRTAAGAGMEANFLTLPWERLPDLPAGVTEGERVWDGYFPWVMSADGRPADEATCWSRETSQEGYLARLRDYYAMAKRVQGEGRIGTYIGCVCPGFDDHRGQAWGEGLKRHLPRDGGRTYAGTWEELSQSGVDTALVITFNDWVESSQIEPSLELGYTDLEATGREVAKWRGTGAGDAAVLRGPEGLWRARKMVGLLRAAGGGARRVPAEEGMPRRSDGEGMAEVGAMGAKLDEVARGMARGEWVAAREMLEGVRGEIEAATRAVRRVPVHLFWEYGFDCRGIGLVSGAEAVGACEFMGTRLTEGGAAYFEIADEEARRVLRGGHFVGRVSFEYLDVGVDFVRVVVDAAEEKRQVIASYKKTNTGRWLRASLDLVNAQFNRGLLGKADLGVRQRAGTQGGVRFLRVDGEVWGA